MFTEFGPIITAAVTPFHADGTLNLPALRDLLGHLEHTGSDAVVVCGTTGESATLTDDEKLQVIRVAVDELGGRIPVIAGTGSNSTHHSIEMTRAACELGVDGVLVVTPYYNKPPREGVVRHFVHVARASSVPVILYNIPARVVINVEPETIADIVQQAPNIVAIKQANPDLAQTSDLRARVPDLAVYAGNDDSLLPMLALGAIGGICVASHVVGTRMGDVVERWMAGDEMEARAIDAELADVYETMSITANPIPVKAAMNLMGIDVGPPRLPLVAATGIETERIRAMLERHKLLSPEQVS